MTGNHDRYLDAAGNPVAKNGNSWFLVEVKKRSSPLSSSLEYFHDLAKTKHTFQIVIDAEYQEVDSFSYRRPVEVPAKTFLSSWSENTFHLGKFLVR